MADASDSKSAVRKDVWVRIPPRAPVPSVRVPSRSASIQPGYFQVRSIGPCAICVPPETVPYVAPGRRSASWVGAGRLRPVPDEDEELAAFADWSTSYRSAGLTLPAFFVAPHGPGPFPGIVFHHGSGGLLPGPSRAEALVRWVTQCCWRFAGVTTTPGLFWESLSRLRGEARRWDRN